MNELNHNDIDYEHMDDLPLADHIEWSLYKANEILPADFDFESHHWQADNKNHYALPQQGSLIKKHLLGRGGLFNPPRTFNLL
ncbi:hypothetical protein Q9L42_014625 [Methylomarinum sp. Ch1-1]|uniref:Uncharacterized protein n=1 Tax=Methylomarinum roseum TaxID=3067653 RepID=A0AAU7NRH5_9GAMM|nr:hypothetical protein [Methylomarinum sp. Ch1-1]MDP4520440.1 hypothetical protein [Methylomarinum sp. Ch1-1]